MTDIGVYISLFNDEFMIKPCVETVKQVFPGAHVFDIGSEDNGPQIVKDAGLTVSHHPDARASDKYIELKRELSEKHDWVFWIDGDEVYPVECLQKVKAQIEADDREMVFGWWRNLRVVDGVVYASTPPIHKGPTAYRPSEFLLHRDWPREKIDRRDGKPRETDRPKFDGIFCWHAVLLRRSPIPDRKNRMKKRNERLNEFAERGLEWEKLGKFPFDCHSDLYLPAMFRWY